MIQIVNDESTVGKRQFVFFDNRHDNVYIVNNAKNFTEAIQVLNDNLLGNIFDSFSDILEHMTQIRVTMAFDKEIK